MKFEIKQYWKFLSWLIIVCCMLFIPANDLPSKPFINIPYFDKIIHFGLFFILGLLAFRPAKILTPNYNFWAPFVTIVIAAVLESTQHKISATRNTDVIDFLANFSGICAATVVFHFFIDKKKFEKFL